MGEAKAEVKGHMRGLAVKARAVRSSNIAIHRGAVRCVSLADKENTSSPARLALTCCSCKYQRSEGRPLHRVQGALGRHHLEQVLLLQRVVQVDAAVEPGSQEQVALRWGEDGDGSVSVRAINNRLHSLKKTAGKR